jgi:hypothetical protein
MPLTFQQVASKVGVVIQVETTISDGCEFDAAAQGTSKCKYEGCISTQSAAYFTQKETCPNNSAEHKQVA